MKSSPLTQGVEYYDRIKTTYSITYSENGATLITSENNSDSENENSDSMDESEERSLP